MVLSELSRTRGFGDAWLGNARVASGRKAMSNRIAFNPQDRFVFSIGNTLVVTAPSGDTFGHDVTGNNR